MAWYHPCTTRLLFTPCIKQKSPATKLITAPIALLKEVWREILQTDSSNRLISQDEKNNRGTDGLSEEFKKLKKCVCLFVSDWLCVKESPGQQTFKGVYVLIGPRKVQRSEVSESKSSSTPCSIKCHIRGNLASLVWRCQATNTKPTCLQNVVAECTAQSDSPALHAEMHLSTNTLQIARVSEQLNITICQLEWLSQNRH